MTQAEGEEPTPAVPLFPALAGDGLGGVVVPTDQQLGQLRDEARRSCRLPDLHDELLALEVAARRARAPLHDRTRLVVLRIEVERELGDMLAEEVRPGRPRKYSGTRVFPKSTLPGKISKDQSPTFQALARIPESVFRRYVANETSQNRLPSSAGLRRFAEGLEERTDSDCRSRGLPDELVDAVVRVLGEIDTCVGDLGVPGRTHMRTADPSQVALRGRVVVDASDDGGAWLRKLQQSVRTGAVTEAIASVPNIQSPACLRALRNGDWTLCIRPDCVLVYKGPRSWAFKVAMEPLGLELAALRGAGPQDRQRWRGGQNPPKFPLTTSDRI